MMPAASLSIVLLLVATAAVLYRASPTVGSQCASQWHDWCRQHVRVVYATVWQLGKNLLCWRENVLHARPRRRAELLRDKRARPVMNYV